MHFKLINVVSNNLKRIFGVTQNCYTNQTQHKLNTNYYMKNLVVLAAFFIFTNFTSVNLEESTIKSLPILIDKEIELVTLDKKLMAFDAFTESFYDCLKEPTLNSKVFKMALKGYYSLKEDGKLANQNYLTVIDYTKPSNEDRFFLIDIERKIVIFRSVIAHGKNSGGLNATKFSNESESRMTSLGFYVTGAIYNGKYDYSMKIHGLEYSNNNAFERGVVVHSADYATYEFLQENGNILGRSYGCPALPHDNYQTIVDIIQGGSCFFAYGKDRGYERKSTYLKTTSFIESFYSDFPQ